MNKEKVFISKKFYEEIRKRINIVERIKAEKEEALSKAPSGKIHIIKNKGTAQYYLRANTYDKAGKYITKDNIELIKTMLQKEYDTKVLALVESELSLLEKILEKSSSKYDKIEKWYLSQTKETQGLVNTIECFDNNYIEIWQSKSYVGKSIPEYTPDFITNKGEHVRSKSEVNIANALYRAGIPYKYECPIKLHNGMLIYPDFTLLNADNRKEMYWEHRGMMDDREYAKNSVARIKDYQKSGIYLGDRLIITEETSSNPLGTVEINNVIIHYLSR